MKESSPLVRSLVGELHTRLDMFAGFVKGYVRRVFHHVAQFPFAGGKISKVALPVIGQAGQVLLFELIEDFFVITGNPSSRGIGGRLVVGVHPILCLQSSHCDVKLQDPHSTQYVVLSSERPKYLYGTFFGHLTKSLLELLCFQRIFQAYATEMLRREVRDTGKAETFFFRKSVTDLDGPVVMDTDDVSGKGFFYIGPVLGHENDGIVQGDFLSGTVVKHLHASYESPRTDADKRDAVPMGWVHIGLDFKGKSGKGRFIG